MAKTVDSRGVGDRVFNQTARCFVYSRPHITSYQEAEIENRGHHSWFGVSVFAGVLSISSEIVS